MAIIFLLFLALENSRKVQTTVGIPNQTPLQGSQSKGIA